MIYTEYIKTGNARFHALIQLIHGFADSVSRIFYSKPEIFDFSLTFYK